MTKCIEVAKLEFDPEKLDDPDLVKIFKSHTAKVLWCCIKAGHITDQFFNEKILYISGVIDVKRKDSLYSYNDFVKIIEPLRDFGRIHVREFGRSTAVIDHEFWGGVYASIERYSDFKIEIVKKD